MYQITEYSKKKAKELGVEIKPSTHKNKKIDVYKNGKFIHSIGDVRYLDFPTFLKKEGKKEAEKHRVAYHKRHTKNTLGEKLALKLLW